MLPSCLAAIRRRRQGHAAAAGSEGIDHGRLPSGCTSGGRLPPLGRSNDRSPPTAMPLYPPHWAPPHARCRPFGARFQYSRMGASQHHNPALGCLSVIYLLSAPGSAVGPQVASHAPPLCLSLAPRLYLRPRALRGGLTRQCEARGVVGLRGCTSTPAATCLCNHHIFMAAEWPRTGGCDVARPPAPLCLWYGARAG